jgi:hypothetical protein
VFGLRLLFGVMADLVSRIVIAALSMIQCSGARPLASSLHQSASGFSSFRTSPFWVVHGRAWLVEEDWGR